MALYDDDDVVNEVVTDFGNGRSLKIILKDDAGGLPAVRRLANLYKQTESVKHRIETLQAKQDSAGPDEFGDIQAEIDRWRALPDEFTMAVELLYNVGKGWDYYPNKEAEEQGQPYEYTQANIARIKPLVLGKVIQNVQAAIGLVGEDEESKKSDVLLPEPSIPADSTASIPSPTGTSSSQTTAP